MERGAIGVNLLKRFEDRSLLTADVTISIADFLNPTVDVLFDGIRDLRTGEPLNVSDPRKRIEGRFYGTEHQEVGGIFEYASVVGSFGAKRDAD